MDNLKGQHNFAIYKVAEAGDTLENMSYGTEIRSNYSRKPPQLTQTLDAVKNFKSKVEKFMSSLTVRFVLSCRKSPS